MITVDYCCLDASAFSFGFASSHCNTLIIEKSENVLSDYVNGIIPCRINSMPVTDNGRDFYEFLKNGECISEHGILDSPSLAPLAAEYAIDYNVILGAHVISIKKSECGYIVKIYTNSGIQNIICKSVISRPKILNCLNFLNCVVSGTDREFLIPIEEYGARIHKCFEKDEFIISMPFNTDISFNEARIQFVSRMRQCFGATLKIDAFATDFVYGADTYNIIKEFEAGVTFEV